MAWSDVAELSYNFVKEGSEFVPFPLPPFPSIHCYVVHVTHSTLVDLLEISFVGIVPNIFIHIVRTTGHTLGSPTLLVNGTFMRCLIHVMMQICTLPCGMFGRKTMVISHVFVTMLYDTLTILVISSNCGSSNLIRS